MRPIRRILFALLAITVIAGCGDDDDASEPREYEVEGADYAFNNMPETVAAGSSFTLTNASQVELHEMVFFRVPDDETRSAEELLALSPDEQGAIFGAPVGVVIAPPGESGMVVDGTNTLTEPGRYGVICFIPTGADPDEYLAAAAASEGGPPEVAGGPPHFVEGMWAELIVE